MEHLFEGKERKWTPQRNDNNHRRPSRGKGGRIGVVIERVLTAVEAGVVILINASGATSLWIHAGFSPG